MEPLRRSDACDAVLRRSQGRCHLLEAVDQWIDSRGLMASANYYGVVIHPAVAFRIDEPP